MARSDLLINLVKAGVAGDKGKFRRTVDAIVAEERAKQHNVVADQLERVVTTTNNGNGGGSTHSSYPEVAGRAKDFLLQAAAPPPE